MMHYPFSIAMIRVKGHYEIHEFGILLALELDKKNFDRFMDHINKNMFFAYSRTLENLKVIQLLSIGDHLNSEEVQNVKKADVAVEVRVESTLSKAQQETLDHSNAWYVHLMCGQESYLFSLDKETQFIKSRLHYPDRNNAR